MTIIVHDKYKSLDNGHDVCIVVLDFRKAFERAWNKGLLELIGVSGPLLNWSYLENRNQRVAH